MLLCCFCKCKDTKLKAIHNVLCLCVCVDCVVFANAKILNWKQFTTNAESIDMMDCCFCKCKDTKLKAIHNKNIEVINASPVVFANAKILNWKQFTTRLPNTLYDVELFLQMQRY